MRITRAPLSFFFLAMVLMTGFGGGINPFGLALVPPANATSSASCPVGTTFNSVSGQCLATPTCPAGTAFLASGASSMCVATATPVCPAGFTYNSANVTCETPPTCPAGTSFVPPYEGSNPFCEGAPSCPSGYSFSGIMDACTVPVTCPSGTAFSTSAGDCEATPVCPAGTLYSSTYLDCESAPTCPSGTSVTANLLTGGYLCESAPTCPSGTTFNATDLMCETSASSLCPSGTTFSSTAGACLATPVCPSGTSLSGSNCVVPATCPAFSSLLDNNGVWQCNAGPQSQACGFPSSAVQLVPGANLHYDSLSAKCEMNACQTTTPASGINSVLFPSNLCEATPVCPSGTYTNSSLYCHEDPSCPAGGTYQYDTLAGVYWCFGGPMLFEQNPPCPAGFTAYPTGSCYADPCPSLTADFPSVAYTFPVVWKYAGASGCTPPSGSATPGYDSSHPGVYPTYVGVQSFGNLNTGDVMQLQKATDNKGYFVYDNNCAQYNAVTASSGLTGVSAGTWTLSLVLSGYVCQSTPACPAGTAATAVILGSNIVYICTASPACPTGTLSGGSCIISSATCPAGTTVVNGSCSTAPSCPSGTSVSGSNCAAVYTCPAGSTYGEFTGCAASPGCPSGTSMVSIYSSEPANCSSPPVCPSGTSPGTACNAPAICPAGDTLNRIFSTCNEAPICPSGTSYFSLFFSCVGAYSCAAGTTFNGATKCVEGPGYSCPAGSNYNPTSLRCEGAFSCPAGTLFFSPLSQCAVQLVNIIVKPGSAQPPQINLKSGGVLPVAILGSSTFNVQSIVVSPLSSAPTFGGSTPQPPTHVGYSDVNLDGYTDLVLQYNTLSTGLTASTTQGCVSGVLTNGMLLLGCATIKVK